MEYLQSHPEVVAAFLSAIAAVAAAIATWRAPITAAKMADQLKRDGEAAQEQRRMKLFIFSTLMQERAQIHSNQAVSAFNLIDVVFSQSSAVREAWADLFNSFDSSKNIPPHVRDERLNKLLREMAADLDMSVNLRLDDFDRVYYPNALAEQTRIQDMERKAALARLGSQLSPSSNTATTGQIAGIYPPRPGSQQA